MAKKKKKRAVKKKKVVKRKKKKVVKKKKKAVKKKKKVVKKKKKAVKKKKKVVKRKKKVAKKKKPAKKKKKRKVNPAFLKPLNASDKLAKVVGKSKITRQDAIKSIWNYIKKKDLQDAKNRRNVNIDSTLSGLFGNKKQVSMFEIAKVISKNLKK